MVNATKRDELLAEFKGKATDLFNQAIDKMDLGVAMEENDMDAVRTVIENVQNTMIGSIPVGLNVPKVTRYVSGSGNDGKITIVNIKITNRLNADKKFSFSISITNGKAREKVFDFMLGVYSALIVDELININLARVNDVLLQATSEAGLDYVARVVSPLGNDGKKVASLSDDEVLFVADEDRVFNLDNIIVLFESATDLISEETIQDNYQNIVDELRTAQTTVQLVGIYGGMLISHVADISKRVKPITLIKKVCTKNVFKLSGNKDSIAYYNKDNVFALLSRVDGQLAVILSPFDTESLVKVDIDVLKEIEA